MIYVGTSGFRFPDWKGHFYPPEVKEKDWLQYYGERFNCLEVNASFYRLMGSATFLSMANRVPDGFLFTVKVYRSLTHEVGSNNAADVTTFTESLKPLQEAGKFGCLLAQFPNGFHNTPGSRQYLGEFADWFAAYPLVIEFRNREWLKEEVFAFLRERGIGWCAVDEPQFRTLMPPVAMATSRIGYVRFHGRNYQNWWKSGEGKDRYDYLYTRDELMEWVPKIQGLADQTDTVYVFMNNCFAGKAAYNAVELREMLKEDRGGAVSD
jgi:uncharacterized protein YecE (DUF72 family)